METAIPRFSIAHFNILAEKLLKQVLSSRANGEVYISLNAKTNAIRRTTAAFHAIPLEKVFSLQDQRLLPVEACREVQNLFGWVNSSVPKSSCKQNSPATK